MPAGQHHLVHLGGKPAVGLFIVCLLAFVAETQLSQYVQANMGFRQPYLLFYIVHSTFAIPFPLHLLYLVATTEYSIGTLCRSLVVALQRHLSPRTATSSLRDPPFPTWKLMRLIFLLTLAMTGPSLMWFIAVTLAPVTDVTALWNTNAFFAYVFAVFLSGVKWDVRRLVAVLIATAGALIVVYGGSTAHDEKSSLSANQGAELSQQDGPKAPLVGDLLTLAASVIYGAYQVLYKMYVALPHDPEAQTDGLYTPIADEPSVDVEDVLDEGSFVQAEVVNPLPFGLYPNMLTSAIGICTLLLLWIPVPILSRTGAEPFELPHRALTYWVIAGIALTGSIFNAGFMVLLGVWGPIVTSVGSLLTIVLVFVSDAIFGGAVETVTIWSVLGCGCIVFAFALLAYDMAKRR